MADGDPAAWHESLQGGYDEDLPLWRELAGGVAGPVLELGAGIGRVAVDVAARTGREVWALDSDAVLLEACARRAARAHATVHCIAQDACTFELQRRMDLIFAPSAFLQIVGDRHDRVAVLQRARRHLTPGGCLYLDIIDLSDICTTGGPYRARRGALVHETECLGSHWTGNTCEVTWARRLSRWGWPAKRELAPARQRFAAMDGFTLAREAADAGLRITDRRDDLLERRQAEPTWIYALTPL